MWPININAEIRKLQFRSMQNAPVRDVTTDTKNGKLTFGSHGGVIARRLYAKRQWSWSLLKNCHRLLVDQGMLKEAGNSTLINVGANIGAVLTPLMRMGNFQHGLGFEPSPSNFRYLQKNVQQNDLADSVEVFQFGLSDQAVTAEFELSPSNCGDHRVRSAGASDRPSLYQEADRQSIPVALRPLDAVLEERNIELADNSLIWVDIQGHEGHFLIGAQNTLKSGVHVVSEFWPYAIHRSGIGKERYFEVVESSFVGFFQFQLGRWRYQPIHQIRTLFDRLDRGRGKSSVDIVLVNAYAQPIRALRAA